MKNMALLLTVSILLLSPALPAKALSLNHNFLIQVNSQLLIHPESSVDDSFGTKAIPQSVAFSAPPDFFNLEANPFEGVTEETMELWKFDSAPPAPTLVPEPASLILFGAGLLGLAGLNRRLIRLNR